MKHATLIILFISVTTGCYSQPPAASAYPQPVIDSLVYIWDYVNFADEIYKRIPYAIDVAGRFRTAFPVDEVRTVTTEVVSAGYALLSLTDTTISSVKNLLELLKIHKENIEGMPSEYLSQPIDTTLRHIDYWYAEVEIWSIGLGIMKNAMDKYGFQYP
jgi:hypothetical protein